MTEHRPWPAPGRRWWMAQTWEQLLFAHWPVDPQALRRVVPPQIPIDQWRGQAWVTVSPFQVNAFRLRLTVPPPVLSSFPELNVRTYVTIDGKPGVYFFSLDTSSRLAVEAARRVYRLPYFHATQSFDGSSFQSQRRHDGPPAEFEGRYKPVGQPKQAAPDTLDFFLAERYCLYTLDDEGQVQRGEIHHRPWPLQAAEVDIERNTMGEQIGLSFDSEPALAHYVERQDVVFWQLEPA